MIKPNLELSNSVKDHLANYPFLKYSLREIDNILYITFSKDISKEYGTAIIKPFAAHVMDESPLKLKIVSRNNIEKFKEFQGKTIIGNIENVDFPGLELKGIPAKIDTGATVSSLAVINLKERDKKVTFTPLDKKFKGYTGKEFTLPIYEKVKVQSSNGDEEVRILVRLKIVLAGKKIDTFFTLSNRSELEYPILIGKDVLNQGFIVDTGL